MDIICLGVVSLIKPVIFIEHRWLHQMSWNGEGRVVLPTQLGKSNRVSTGSDITIVSNSIGSVYSHHAANILKNITSV